MRGSKHGSMLWGSPWPRVLARSAALAAILLTSLLAPAACKKKDAPEPPPELAQDADAALVGQRPSLPPRSAGLAQLPVFPEVDAPLTVLRSEPADGAEGVPVDAEKARFVLRFNHPVVALDAEGDRAQPARLEPAVAGQGEWLDTATWVFSPSEDLPPSTAFTLRLDPALEDRFGNALEGDLEIGFTTAWPALLRSLPESGAIDAGATRAISMSFNQAMDPASTEAAFELRPAGGEQPVAGDYRWDGPNTLIFQPQEPLEREREYVATIAAGARSAGGAAESPEDASWSFTTAPRPRLVETQPADGEQDSIALRGGDLQLIFNTPMDRETLTVTVQPTITHLGIWWSDEDRVAHVTGGWLASERYRLRLPASTTARSGDPLGEDQSIAFSVAPMAPSLQVRTTSGFSQFGAREPVVVYADTMNLPEVTFAIHEIGTDDFLDLTTGEARWQLRDALELPASALMRRWTVDASAPVDLGRRISTTLTTDAGAALAPGIYLMDVVAAEIGPASRSRTILSLTEVNLSLKLTRDEILVWATDLQSAAPVPGLSLTAYEGKGRPLVSGTTDADGIFRGAIERTERAWEPIVVLAEDAGRVVAAVSSEWSAGLEPYAFNIGYDPEPRMHYGTVYTDRPLYRPAQTVYFRGLLREDEDARYRLPEAESVRVLVRDPDWETLMETDLPLTGFGSFSGSLELSPLARLGNYQIEVLLPGEDEAEPETVAGAGFRVAAYRKPEFEIEVSTDQPDYRQGETIQAQVSARYFFGGAVKDASLRWRLLSDDFFFRPPDLEGSWDWIDYDLTEARYHDAQGEVVAEGEGQTDDEGRFSFEIPADVAEYPLSQVFTIDVEITDLDQRSVAGRGSAVVHKSGLYLGLQPQAYVIEAGDPARFDLLAVDPDGAALEDRDIQLELYEREWFSVRENREDGAFYWTSSFTDTLVAEASATSDAEGRAEASLPTRRAGIHRLVATSTDASGNIARSASYVWVTGSGYVNWRQENNDRIDLVADKKAYAPGDTARILIPSPFDGAQALVTVERGGIRDVSRRELEGNGETLEIPISVDDAPNIYVSVLLVKGLGPDNPIPEMRLGYTNLPVSTAQQELDIRLEPDHEGPYAPRQPVTWTVTVRDHAGNPARAELSLAMVDKALLALTDESGPSLEQAFFGQRMLGVGTASGLTQSGLRLAREMAAEKKGGGGGGPGSAGTVRRLMQDTAFWAPAVLTDEDGRAELSLSLPDNLTTWQMEARGVTGAETLVGSARRDLLSTQEILLQPVLPRFLVVGDTVQIESVVQNRGDQPRSLEIRIDSIGLELEGDAARSVDLPAGGKAKVAWQLRVPSEGLNPAALPDSFGEARVRIRAEGDGPGDAIEVDLPVYQFSAAERVATAGEVDQRVTERIDLPRDADLSQGSLRVEVEPSLLSAAIAAARWLDGQAFVCSEPIAGRLMADVAVWQALQASEAAAAADPVLLQRLESSIPLEAQRLVALQGLGGGWSWCDPGGEPQPWLSAYALSALSLAESAGFAVSLRGIDSGTAYLIAQLDSPVDAEAAWDLDQRAFITWVLAERESVSLSRVQSLYERRDGLSPHALAFLALALDRLGAETQADRVQALLAELGSLASRSATGAWWDEPIEPWTLSTGLRTTAIASFALARIDAEATVLPAALRWLMHERRDDHWRSTQETVWAIRAIATWSQAGGDASAGDRFHVELNDRELGSGELAAASDDPALSVEVAVSELEPSNALVIRHDGRGKLYYQAQLEVYRPAESLAPRAEGIVLGREYFAVDPVSFEARGEPIDSARVGDLVEARLTLVSETGLRFVELEDFIPAGFEIVDTSLKSTSAAARGPALEQADAPSDLDLPWWRRAWWLSWSESQLRDERAVLMAESLEPGTYVYRYLLRASLAGNYKVIPASVKLSWFPEVFGRSAGGIFTIEAID